MPNVTVAQQKLVLNSFAAILQNNLVASDLVTWKKFDGEMNDRNGLKVVEQVPPRYNVTTTVNGVQDLSGGTQDTVFGSETYEVNRTFGSSMGWGDFVKIRDINDARESEALKAAALNMSETIDAYILKTAALASSDWTGTPGTAAATYDDIANGYTRLKENGVPDSELRAVLTYGDKQSLGEWIVDNNSSGLSGAEGVYRKGFTGTVAGIPSLFTQQLPTLIFGTRGTSTVNAASQNVDYKAVANSAAPGQYMTQTLNIKIGSGTETIKDGEVFTIAGVYAYDNRLGAALPRLQQFRVIGDYTAVAGVVSNARIFPAIIVPGTGSGGDIGVNTANATVSAVPGATASITWLGTGGAAVTPRFIANKAAVIVNCADLIMPATGIGTRKSLTKIPLSVRMWQNSDFATGQHDVRFDVALTANIGARGRVQNVRINGS